MVPIPHKESVFGLGGKEEWEERSVSTRTRDDAGALADEAAVRLLRRVVRFDNSGAICEQLALRLLLQLPVSTLRA